jgi:hypothetical protein
VPCYEALAKVVIEGFLDVEGDVRCRSRKLFNAMQPLNLPTHTSQETTVSDLGYAENILFCHPQILQSPAIVLRM